MGAMDPHEKLCLDHIKMQGNQGQSSLSRLGSHSRSERQLGMWTRRLKTSTGLHQNVINRCLKVLEQRKLIKQVKSVKVSCAH
jgi:hypothetical protein